MSVSYEDVYYEPFAGSLAAVSANANTFSRPSKGKKKEVINTFEEMLKQKNAAIRKLEAKKKKGKLPKLDEECLQRLYKIAKGLKETIQTEKQRLEMLYQPKMK